MRTDGKSATLIGAGVLVGLAGTIGLMLLVAAHFDNFEAKYQQAATTPLATNLMPDSPAIIFDASVPGDTASDTRENGMDSSCNGEEMIFAEWEEACYRSSMATAVD